MNMIAEVDQEAMHLHSQLRSGLSKISVALGSGDIIVAAVAAGGSIRIRDACEGVEVVLAHHAWVAITHPSQAGMHAARHLMDETTQISLESAAGAVWHYQRRRRTVGLNSRAETPVETGSIHNRTHHTDVRTEGSRSPYPATNGESHPTHADSASERHTPENARPTAPGASSQRDLLQCVSHVIWPQHLPHANTSWNKQPTNCRRIRPGCQRGY